MSDTTKTRTQHAKPKSRTRRQVKGAKARSTVQPVSETKGTARHASAQADAEEPKSPEASARVLEGVLPERAQHGEESETIVADYRPVHKEAKSVEVALAQDPDKDTAALESGHLDPIHEKAPLRGRTLLELCMSNPSFRAKVISHVIRKLG